MASNEMITEAPELLETARLYLPEIALKVGSLVTVEYRPRLADGTTPIVTLGFNPGADIVRIGSVSTIGKMVHGDGNSWTHYKNERELQLLLSTGSVDHYYDIVDPTVHAAGTIESQIERSQAEIDSQRDRFEGIPFTQEAHDNFMAIFAAIGNPDSH